MSHTPGPWQINNEQNVVDADDRVIQVCGVVRAARYAHQKDNAGYANARLIAAAPEMYDALKVAEAILRDYGLLADAHSIGKVLAKAEGRS